MRRTVKYPALMIGRPPRHKNPRIAICALDTEVEVEEMDRSEFPVAARAVGRTTKDFRSHGGKLFCNTFRDVERFFRMHGEHCLDSRTSNSVTGHLVRDMHTKLSEARLYDDALFWPPGMRDLLRRGGDLQTYQPVRTSVEQSANVSFLSGSGGIEALERKGGWLAGDPATRMAAYERAAREAFGAFRILEGAVWQEVPEPCYAVRFDETYTQVIGTDVGAYDTDGENRHHSWVWDLAYRAFSALDHDLMASSMHGQVRDYTYLEVLMPEAFTSDISALETDRCARVLAGCVSRGLASRAKEADKELELPGTDVLTAWTNLADRLKTYGPREGVDPVVEGLAATLLGTVSGSDVDRDLIPSRTAELARGYLERWRDREVVLDLSQGMAVTA